MKIKKFDIYFLYRKREWEKEIKRERLGRGGDEWEGFGRGRGAWGGRRRIEKKIEEAEIGKKKKRKSKETRNQRMKKRRRKRKNGQSVIL